MSRRVGNIVDVDLPTGIPVDLDARVHDYRVARDLYP